MNNCCSNYLKVRDHQTEGYAVVRSYLGLGRSIKRCRRRAQKNSLRLGTPKSTEGGDGLLARVGVIR